ncbi:MAG: hypothetical protein HDT28_01770 [Clostridiales bacterium]|nr:hypothetical protein [Clostridiales bacterium]
MIDNPFAIVSPEELTAQQADQLFVEMHSDYPEITRQGNTLVTGARGCGKSMLIRCSLPDFLMVRRKIKFSQLPYLALNVSIKKTAIDIQELHKLDNQHIPFLINEHFLTLHVVMHSLLCLTKVTFETEKYSQSSYKYFFENVYVKYLKAAGCKDIPEVDYTTPNSFFMALFDHMNLMSYNFMPYLNRLYSNKGADLTYSLPLLSFSRFIVPVYKALIELPGFPNNKPILIFIDDADNLSEIQTRILNSWLASRTQPTISLKVFSQIGLYKSYLTSSGVLVESPHDYQEVNISSIYTTKFRNPEYYNKVLQILIRRLQLSGYAEQIELNNKEAIELTLKNFFPSYKKQEEGIKQEEERIRAAYKKTNGRGYRENDDVRRYAIPNYIRGLGGLSKSRSTYQYAGLENIIHLSSGIIRYLLDSVAKMYDTAAKRSPDVSSGNRVEFIPSNIQDEVMRAKADFYLFTELRKNEKNDDSSVISTTENPISLTDKLANLINAMGKTFQEILLSGNNDDPLSGRAERKVFSIALSNPERTSQELKQVFKLGVRLGFLHESFIGNKEGNGRTYLYILNRCFAPIFTLDPTGFQGYLFMTNEDLTTAIHKGNRLRKINNTDSDLENGLYQLSLFDYWEE